MKKKVLLSLLLGSIVVSGCSCSVRNKQNPENNNQNDSTVTITDENVVAPQDVDGIVFENIGFQVQNGVATVVTQYTNTSDSEFKLDNYKIIIIDKDGIVLTTLIDMVNQTLAPNETKTSNMTFQTEIDMTATVKVDYEINVEVPYIDSENLPE